MRPRFHREEVRRAKASQEELAALIARHRPGGRGDMEPLPGLFLYYSAARVGPLYRVSQPSICLIAQGSKEVLLGKERYQYDPARYLLLSNGLPLVSRILEASEERPYLGLRILLDPALITSVLVEADHLAPRANGDLRALTVSKVSAPLLDAVVRLVRLVDTPRDYQVLAPLIVREIVYRLLLGQQRGRLRRIAAVGSSERRMTEAIELIRANYDKPLHVARVAKDLGMSVSGFHHHFKSATTMSPLQFQKQLRLLEARRLLITDDCDAATAAYRVGYDDPSHFSREYKRLFGEPPMRDVERLRASVRVATGASAP